MTGRRIGRVGLRGLVVVVHVFGATIKAVTGGGNAPMLPPSAPPKDPRDYRP